MESSGQPVVSSVMYNTVGRNGLDSKDSRINVEHLMCVKHFIHQIFKLKFNHLKFLFHEAGEFVWLWFRHHSAPETTENCFVGLRKVFNSA